MSYKLSTKRVLDILETISEETLSETIKSHNISILETKIPEVSKINYSKDIYLTSIINYAKSIEKTLALILSTNPVIFLNSLSSDNLRLLFNIIIELKTDGYKFYYPLIGLVLYYSSEDIEWTQLNENIYNYKDFWSRNILHYIYWFKKNLCILHKDLPAFKQTDSEGYIPIDYFEEPLVDDPFLKKYNNLIQLFTENKITLYVYS